MEALEIFNEDGFGTGIYKNRSAVHRDGDLHGSAHVWVVREGERWGDFFVLLQKRSPDKDAFPNCFDTSCAGHVAQGETFESTALRELEEELGIVPKDALTFLFDQRVGWESQFHGKTFVNNEINRVFLLYAPNVDVSRFQKEEITGLFWQNAADVLSKLRAGDERYCIQLPLFERLVEAVSKMRVYDIYLYECWGRPDSSKRNGRDEWTCGRTFSFFGTKEFATQRAQAYAEEVRQSDTCGYLESVSYRIS